MILMDNSQLLNREHYECLVGLIDGWLEQQLRDNPIMVGVHCDDLGLKERRWYIRVLGEQKDTFTVRLTLRERMLHYETYVMPMADGNKEYLFTSLLGRNRRLVGASFCIGEEGAIFLVGAIPARTVDLLELDRLLGTLWAAVEDSFGSLIRIAFPRRFSD